MSTTEETEMQYTLTGYVLFIGNNRGGHYKVTVEDIIIVGSCITMKILETLMI